MDSAGRLCTPIIVAVILVSSAIACSGQQSIGQNAQFYAMDCGRFGKLESFVQLASSLIVGWTRYSCRGSLARESVERLRGLREPGINSDSKKLTGHADRLWGILARSVFWPPFVSMAISSMNHCPSAGTMRIDKNGDQLRRVKIPAQNALPSGRSWWLSRSSKRPRSSSALRSSPGST